MDSKIWSRRAVLTAAAAWAAAPGLALAAPPLAGIRFREIRVDVSPLRANGSADAADWVAATLPELLRRSFAAHLAPGDRNGATLVARIDEVILGPANSRFPFTGSDATDGIQGTGIVLGPHGQEIASYPMYNAVGAATMQNQPYQREIMRGRVETLAQSFAESLPGQMGL